MVRHESLCREVSNGQGQGHGHLNCKHLANADRQYTYCYWQTIEIHVCFRLKYLHLTLANTNGQHQGRSYLDSEYLQNCDGLDHHRILFVCNLAELHYSNFNND